MEYLISMHYNLKKIYTIRQYIEIQVTKVSIKLGWITIQ